LPESPSAIPPGQSTHFAQTNHISEKWKPCISKRKKGLLIIIDEWIMDVKCKTAIYGHGLHKTIMFVPLNIANKSLIQFY
jgi:hypothetical protein